MAPSGSKAATLLRVALVTGVLLAGCGENADKGGDKAERFAPVPLKGVAYADTAAEYPHLLYTDGTQTLNDRCPVRKSKLNRRMPPVYVNHRPIGFC